MDYVLVAMLGVSAIMLAALVWLMWRSASRSEWKEFSSNQKGEIRKEEEKRKAKR